MESLRQKKLARLLQKSLGDYFVQHFRAALPGIMVTVTTVRISPDLALAHIYLSLFPSPNAMQALEEIRQHQRSIRGHLGSLIGKQVRIIPELIFHLDDSLDYLENIEKLLKE